MTHAEQLLEAYHRKSGHRDMTDLAGGAERHQIVRLLAAQAGNAEKGKTPEYLEKRWVRSPEFVPMILPVEILHPVRVPPPGESGTRSVGPIVVEINFRNVFMRENRRFTDFVPRTVIIDGQHRWNEAKLAGEKFIHAIVGTLAVPILNKSLILWAWHDG